MGSRTVNLALQLVLAVLIIFLGFQLYESITGPAREKARVEALQKETRNRMDFIRQAMIQQERVSRRFMGSLDSVLVFMKRDSSMQALAQATLKGLPIDSVVYSPISGKRFVFSTNDSVAFSVYRLDDETTGYYIGTLDPDDLGGRNVASWE